MMQNQIFFTAGQFARLHRLNKRTLHYYDEIGLFSPAQKGENGYRYYTFDQSAALEHILALRELNMTIEEIKAYLTQPTAQRFLALSEEKMTEIDRSIGRLEQLKSTLQKKRECLCLSAAVQDGQIDLIQCEEESLLITPLPHPEQDTEYGQMKTVLAHLQAVWDLNHNKSSCGSLISVNRVRAGRFAHYNGLFTPIERPAAREDFHCKPAGMYLRGFCRGAWDKLPRLYRQMLSFAEAEGLALVGYAYETGLNEGAISHLEEYVTQVLIPCRPRQKKR